MDKNAKLTRIIIQTKEYQIGNDCNLYATQFGKLRWKIDKRNKESKQRTKGTITLTNMSGASKQMNSDYDSYVSLFSNQNGLDLLDEGSSDELIEFTSEDNF